ncbi:MAG: hypothetical protein QW648_00800 [Nanoarchaeales archaeon]
MAIKKTVGQVTENIAKSKKLLEVAFTTKQDFIQEARAVDYNSSVTFGPYDISDFKLKTIAIFNPSTELVFGVTPGATATVEIQVSNKPYQKFGYYFGFRTFKIFDVHFYEDYVFSFKENFASMQIIVKHNDSANSTKKAVFDIMISFK